MCRSDHRSHLTFRRASLRWAPFLGWVSSATKIRISCVGGLWGAWLVSLLVLRRTCVRLGVVPCRCRCVVACVSRGMEGCGEWLLARTIILRLLHRALSSIKVLRYRVPSSPICPFRRDPQAFSLLRVFLLFSGGKRAILAKKKASSRSGFPLSMHVDLKTKYVNPNIHVSRY